MPEYVLLDTDVFSYWTANRPEVEVFGSLLKGKTLCLSFISIGELLFGAHNRNWGSDRFQMLRLDIKQMIMIPYNNEMPERYAWLAVECKRKGRPIAINDAWIAATALAYNIPLVTNNVEHFNEVPDLRLIHPKLRES